jgi:hypothetical protein
MILCSLFPKLWFWIMFLVLITTITRVLLKVFVIVLISLPTYMKSDPYVIASTFLSAFVKLSVTCFTICEEY